MTPWLLCPWDSPGKNTGAGCHVLLQGIFPAQGWKPHLLRLLHWQADSLPLHHQESPGVKGVLPTFMSTWRPYVALFGNRPSRCGVRPVSKDSCLYNRKERKFRHGERQGRGPVTMEAGLGMRLQAKGNGRFQAPSRAWKNRQGSSTGGGPCLQRGHGPAAAWLSGSSR